jgi:hypothetical protein
MEISSATLPSFQPGFHVAIIGSLGIRDREQKAFAPVQKASPQKIGPEKRPTSRE